MKLIKLLVAALVMVCFALQIPTFADDWCGGADVNQDCLADYDSDILAINDCWLETCVAGTEPCCSADIDGNGVVNGVDYPAWEALIATSDQQQCAGEGCPTPCGADTDVDGVFSRSCNLGDQYTICSVTEEACNSVADCPTTQCSATGEECAIDADCPTGVCNNGGAGCAIDDDCPDYGSAGVCEPLLDSQTCDAITQTCGNPPSRCTGHPTEVDCTVDTDCNGICTYTGEPCTGELNPDGTSVGCSFGNCITEGSTCNTVYTCVGGGASCVEDANCDEVCDPADNCPDVANQDQVNVDPDIFGDACDNCPAIKNNSQADVDNNGLGDICDNTTIYGKISGDIRAGVSLDINVYACGLATPVATVTTDANGYYAIGGLENNTYGIIPEYPNIIFWPHQRGTSIPQTSIREFDFLSVDAP